MHTTVQSAPTGCLPDSCEAEKVRVSPMEAPPTDPADADATSDASDSSYGLSGYVLIPTTDADGPADSDADTDPSRRTKRPYSRTSPLSTSEYPNVVLPGPARG